MKISFENRIVPMQTKVHSKIPVEDTLVSWGKKVNNLGLWYEIYKVTTEWTSWRIKDISEREAREVSSMRAVEEKISWKEMEY